VTIIVRKGKQYRFASFDVVGLPGPDRQKALSLWEMKAGEPMDALCVNEYLKSLFQTVHPSKSAASTMKVRPGTDQVDVSVTFK
jgi:hypothetical protein